MIVLPESQLKIIEFKKCKRHDLDLQVT